MLAANRAVFSVMRRVFSSVAAICAESARLLMRPAASRNDCSVAVRFLFCSAAIVCICADSFAVDAMILLMSLSVPACTTSTSSAFVSTETLVRSSRRGP